MDRQKHCEICKFEGDCNVQKTSGNNCASFRAKENKMNTKERIVGLITKHKREAKCEELGSTDYCINSDVLADQILGLFLSEEEIKRLKVEIEKLLVIKDFRMKTWLGCKVNRSQELDEQEEERKTFDYFIDLASALSTTLKPSWTELELDAILPKNKENEAETATQGFASYIYMNDGSVIKCGQQEAEIYNQAISACKQALLGQGGEKG